MISALQQVQNRVAEIRDTLPADVELTIDRLTPAAFPVFSLNLTGGLAPADLRDEAFYVIRPALARVPGVGRVDVSASDTREIEVVVDPGKLVAAGLTVDDVTRALNGSNVLQPVGHYPAAGTQHLVIASGLWESTDQIGATPLAGKDGTMLTVNDVARVVLGAPDRTSLVAGKGGSAAAISISQQIGANILDLRRDLEAAVTQLTRALPSGLHLTKTYDLAAFVATAIANVRDAILIGGVLAVLVLLLFLRNWRLTAVAASTLPLTVVSTFLFMWIFGESINLMSMGGMAVAIGLVIDDAVVVVENIHRRLAAGGDVSEVEAATHELVAPIVSSTLTTVVVFAPLALLSGVVGDFFKALSITLSAAVLISLVLSLTLIPLLSRAAHRREAASTGDYGGWSGIGRFYARTLPWTLDRPLFAIGAAVLLAGAVVVTYSAVGTGFFPAADEGGFVIDYLTAPGMTLEETDARLTRIDHVLDETPEVASYVRRTGSEMGMFATQQNSGDVLVRLKPRNERRRSAEAVIGDLRDQLAKTVPDTEIEFVQLLQDMLGDLEGAPTPIEIKIFGDDQAQLESISAQIEERLADKHEIAGVVDVVGVERGGPEVTWRVDRVAAARLGLSVDQVTAQLSAAWLGQEAAPLRLLDRTIPVRVRFPDDVRFSGSRLAQMLIRGAGGQLVPVSSLVTITEQGPQAELWRENLRQMALVTARLESRDLGSAVADVQRMLAGMELPVGYTYEVGGQYQSQRTAFRQLIVVAAIATALVFVILVIQFRKFTPALLILLAAPLSLGGAFALLLVTGTDLNISAAMGLILLVGLVVKNGIVLLDFAERRRDDGLPLSEAVLTAARVRLRPILMTTFCTLFGLLPLALGLGAGAELQKPLALAVIGGLALSTAVTLYLIPSAYLALSRRRDARR
jgi:CzcA family heavy metal efflux pump